jgi:hypothetical protein
MNLSRMSKYIDIFRFIRKIVVVACLWVLATTPVFAGPVAAVDTIADLNRLPPAYAAVIVAGYRLANDGGGGLFTWAATSTVPPDDVLVFASQTSPNGRWLRQWNSSRLAPEAAGALGDGQTDDHVAFDRLVGLSRRLGAFTIGLRPGRHYLLAQWLDMSIGAPGLTLEGAGAAHRNPSAHEALAGRIELVPGSGSFIKLGDSQTIRNVLVWRHGLPDQPQSLVEVRHAVDQWVSESGAIGRRSIAIEAPFPDVTVDGVTIIGFHTGLHLTGSRFKIRHCLIDAAGYGIEAHDSKDTSLIEDVQIRGLWSEAISGRDRLGDSSYRPGAAFYVHDSADGLQMNSVMAIGWNTGIWLSGGHGSDDWLISLFQPNIETPSDPDHPTAAIRTSGDVRRLTIIDPRIVIAGAPGGQTVGLDFGQMDANPHTSANNNVTISGGVVEIDSTQGTAVLIRPGSTGYLTGTTLVRQGPAPLITAQAGSGRWTIDHPQLLAGSRDHWIDIAPAARLNITLQE